MRIWAIASLMLVMAMTSCSTAVGTRHAPQVTGGPGAKLSAYRMLEVRPFTTADGLAEFQGHVAKMRSALLEALPAERLFPQVSAEQTPGAASGVLGLDARLLRAKSVSRSERVMWGMMAGRSGIEMEVTLTDKSSGKEMARDVILVQTSLSAGAFSGTDRETIDQMAREIISFLKQLR